MLATLKTSFAMKLAAGALAAAAAGTVATTTDAIDLEGLLPGSASVDADADLRTGIDGRAGTSGSLDADTDTGSVTGDLELGIDLS